MNRFFLFIMSLCAALCSGAVYAQKTVRQMSIDEIFLLADQNSKSLRAGATGIKEAQEAVKVAQTARLPEIETSLSFSYLGNGYLMERDFSNGMSAPIPHFGNNFAIEVSQIIYSGGAVSNGIAAAKLQKEAAQLSLESDRNQLLFVLAGHYFDLYQQQNQLRVYENNIEQIRQMLKDIRAKENEGVVLKNDITRYELLLSNLELNRMQVQNTIAILNDHLTTTLGLPEDIVIVPDTAILSQVLPVEKNGYWLAATEENSPALKQLSLNVEMNRLQENIAKSELLPRVVLFAANHLDGPVTIEVPPINKNFNYWYVGVGVNYKLSSLFKADKSLNKSRIATQRTKEEYDDAKEQMELAVKAGSIKYMEACYALQTQQKSVELANQNYAVVSNRYQNDMALIADMLDASNAKLTAELQLVNSQINIVFNYYKLLYLSGTL